MRHASLQPLTILCKCSVSKLTITRDNSADVGTFGSAQPTGPSGAALSLYMVHKQPHARLPLEAHPDLMAVLTACAAHLWIKPMLLHSCVCRLEEHVAAAEAVLAAQQVVQSPSTS